MEKFIDNILDSIFSGSYGFLNINFSIFLLVLGVVSLLFFRKKEKSRKWKFIGRAAVCLGVIGFIVNMLQ